MSCSTFEPGFTVNHPQIDSGCYSNADVECNNTGSIMAVICSIYFIHLAQQSMGCLSHVKLPAMILSFINVKHRA